MCARVLGITEFRGSVRRPREAQHCPFQVGLSGTCVKPVECGYCDKVLLLWLT